MRVRVRVSGREGVLGVGDGGDSSGTTVGTIEKVPKESSVASPPLSMSFCL